MEKLWLFMVLEVVVLVLQPQIVEFVIGSLWMGRKLEFTNLCKMHRLVKSDRNYLEKILNY